MTSDSRDSPVTTVIDLRGRAAAGLTRLALESVLPRAGLDVERALRAAVAFDPKVGGVPSTKGVL